VHLDREFVAQQPGKVVRIDIVGWVDAMRLHVLAVLIAEIVVDGQEQPARAHRVEQRPHSGLAGGLGQRRILHRQQVERPGRERCAQGIPADPLDDGVGPFGCLPRPDHCHLGDLDCGDRPATARQPDRVSALAAADVERPARREADDFGDEPPIRASAPPRTIALAVPRVPFGGLRRRAGPLLAALVPIHASQRRPPSQMSGVGTSP